jgi:aryl-alcohol dehydrogenase
MDVDAAVFRPGVADAQVERLHRAQLRPGEVLVRLVATGICHTDLTCRDGFMALPRPIILGHEGAGVVEALGEGATGLSVGDPVVLTFASCGACASCRDRAPAYCDSFIPANFSGRRLDGSTVLHDNRGEVAAHFFGQSSFATHSVVAAASAIKVRSDAPLELLGPLGCGFQTGAGAVFNVLAPKSGGSIAVFGAGGVGLSAVMAAKVAGYATIIAVEPVAERRALALELGATHAIDPLGDDGVVARLREIAAAGVNHAIDTSGLPEVIGHAIDALAARGQIALITAASPETRMPNALLPIVMRGIGIRGVCMGDSRPAELIPQLVDLFMEGRFPIDRLVRFYDFAEVNRALDDQRSGATVKPILRISKR